MPSGPVAAPRGCRPMVRSTGSSVGGLNGANGSSELGSGVLRSGNLEFICARTRGSSESATPWLVRSRVAFERQKRATRRTARLTRRSSSRWSGLRRGRSRARSFCHQSTRRLKSPWAKAAKRAGKIACPRRPPRTGARSMTCPKRRQNLSHRVKFGSSPCCLAAMAPRSTVAVARANSTWSSTGISSTVVNGLKSTWSHGM